MSPLPKAGTLADNVVVTPTGQTPAPAPAPASPTSVNVQPVQPVEQAPVVVPPHRTVVTEDRPHNYMATIAVSALLGAVAGALIGGAIYFLDTPRSTRSNIGYWAAGGVLVGTGVGLINVDGRREPRRAGGLAAPAERDPVPTYRLSLLQTRF